METKELVECEACPNKVEASQLKKFGSILMCASCYTKETAFLELAKQNNPIPATLPNPMETANAAMKARNLTQSELFEQASKDEQLKIASLDLNTAEGQQILSERIQLLEAIAYETKARAVIAYKAKREIEAKSGKTRWDKTRGTENASNNSDPRNSPLLKNAQQIKKVELSKLEKIVAGRISLGDNDDEIIDMLTMGNKFKGIEVREAITKLRS